MRVLVVSQYYWPESFQINDVVRTLRKKGIDVEVLTGKPNYPKGEKFEGYRSWGWQKENHKGGLIYRLPMLGRGQGAVRLAANYLSFVLSGLIFAPLILWRKKYDVIFIYAPSPILQAIPAIFLGWLKKCPVILWVQDLWPESLAATGHIKNQAMLKVVEWVVQCIYHHSDLLLVQSPAFIAAVGALAPEKRLLYFPNSVNDSFLNPVEVVLPDIPALENSFSIMFAGNVGMAQAVPTIVEAAVLLRDVPEICFVILGDGSQWEWMQHQIRVEALTNLHLAGHFPVEAMPGLMQKADVLMVTLADQPIFAATIPNKIQAYMAVGKPVLACMNGEGARLVKEADGGRAVPAEDARALADAVLELFNMTPAERTRLGENAKNYFKSNFDHEYLMSQLIEHFVTVSISHKDS